MAAVSDEIRERILHGRVQKTIMIAPLTLGLEIYAQHKRHYLLVSADSQKARIHFCSQKLRSGIGTPSPLLLLLRKYVRGARLKDVDQPALERVLHLVFDGPQGRVILIVEVMGRHSNIILTNTEDTILECIKRVPPSRSRYRTLLSHK